MPGFLAQAGFMLAMWLLSRLLTPSAPRNRAQDQGAPTADPKRPIPVVWGTQKVQPNVFWWGDVAAPQEFTFRGEFAGFTYYSGVAMTLCWGPIDSIEDVIFDETRSIRSILFNDPNASNTFEPSFPVERPVSGLGVDMNFDFNSLFGGPNTGDGGIRGTVVTYFGTEEQVADTYLQDKLDDQMANQYITENWMYHIPGVPYELQPPLPNFAPTMSALKRISYVIFKGWLDAPSFYWGINPQIKPVHFVVKRLPSALNGAATAAVGENEKDANAAEIVYEILTEDYWGLKIPVDKIDLPSFQACAETLFDEGLGVSLVADGDVSGYDMIDEVLKHVDGVRYTHPLDGKIHMDLMRGGYDPDALLVIDESNSSDLTFENPSYIDLYTSVKVTWTNPSRAWEEDSVDWQNQATLEVSEEEKRADIQMRGFTRQQNAYLAAERAGKSLTVPTAKARFSANRGAYSLVKGSVFTLHYATRNIGPVVMRVSDIDYGSLEDGRIEISAMSDTMFGADSAVQPPDTIVTYMTIPTFIHEPGAAASQFVGNYNPAEHSYAGAMLGGIEVDATGSVSIAGAAAAAVGGIAVDATGTVT